MTKPALICLIVLLFATACGLPEGIQRGRPTPTPPPFATATPGGRISVPLSETETAPRAPTASGQAIPAAATATAISATVSAATAIAARPIAVPDFLSGECPAPGGPALPPAPTNFATYPEVIGRFLTAGGATTLLEAALRQWGALELGGVVQADTDLTGDRVPEVVITVYDPVTAVPNATPAGVLLVYGCTERAYRLLYSTPFSPDAALPTLLRVGDMNGDQRGELVYSQVVCAVGACTRRVQILGWNAALGQFLPLNDVPIEGPYARFAIGDPDGDGILELAVLNSPPADALNGPPRNTTVYWDWDGQNYLAALVVVAPPIYRIHVLHDADRAFDNGDLTAAIRGYDRVRDDPALLGWTDANEPITLRAFAGLRKLYAQIANNQRTRAEATLQTLVAENPPGTSGESYAAIGTAFMENYRRTRNRVRACAAALPTVQSRPDALIALNGYGMANRTYSQQDLCPFR